MQTLTPEQIVMTETCYDLGNLQITCYSREKVRKIPTQTKKKVQDLIHDYHTFCVVFVKLCQTMGGAASWNPGLGTGNLSFFFTMT
jgi:hypothetical protein